MALASGKSIRWVADQLGHASTRMTLDTYAHAIREEETDLSFVDFDVPARPDAALAPDSTSRNDEAPSRNAAKGLLNLWRARHDSNVRPPAPQAGALSN